MSPHRRVSAQRPPSAQWSGVAGVSRAACPPKAQRHSSPELNSGILGSQRPVFFCPCSCRRRNWPPFFSFLHFHSEMAESLSPLAPEPAVPCREMPSSLRPLPLCASLPANARNPADQISLFPICRWFGPIGRVSAVPRLVAGAHIFDALDRRDSIVMTPITIPAAKIEAAFPFLPQVRHRTARRAKSGRVRGPSWPWPCRLLVLEVVVVVVVVYILRR